MCSNLNPWQHDGDKVVIWEEQGPNHTAISNMLDDSWMTEQTSLIIRESCSRVIQVSGLVLSSLENRKYTMCKILTAYDQQQYKASLCHTKLVSFVNQLKAPSKVPRCSLTLKDSLWVLSKLKKDSLDLLNPKNQREQTERNHPEFVCLPLPCSPLTGFWWCESTKCLGFSMVNLRSRMVCEPFPSLHTPFLDAFACSSHSESRFCSGLGYER